MAETYAPLWCKSAGSFLEGASPPEALVERAHALGLETLALTDRDGVYGIVQAHVRARELGLRLITGSEVTLAADPQAVAARLAKGKRTGDEKEAQSSTLVLFAESRRGYAHLCRLLSAGRQRAPKGYSVLGWGELAEHAEGLVALWGGARSAIAAPQPPSRAVVSLLREAFGDRLYALCARHEAPGERALERRVRARARRWGLEVVAGREVLYHDRSLRPLQDVLTCIRHGVRLQEAGRRLRPNAEHDLLAPAAMATLWRDDPAALARSREVAARCRFSLDELHYRYPSERLADGTRSIDRLRALVFAGARERYGDPVPAAVRAQLERELALIEELDYPGYFLTMHEIVAFCRSRDILCQGRGSAANSAVCYCLGITAIDPVRMQLLFERFISRERGEPPDIDLDIAHERREEVIAFVYERYGRERAAMVANVVRYRSRSAVRDVGKALGIAPEAIERIAQLIVRSDEPLERLVAHAGLDPRSAVCRWLVRLVEQIRGLPRHLSIHPGGFLLGAEPVCELVPVERAAMAGRTVIQWDKRDVEALGLFKVDLLGLGALTLVDRCLALVREHEGRDMSLATIPPEDPATYAMLRQADTIGVFQLESRAQMSMLPRLAPRTWYDLVVQISIVRPGPIAGDMVHPYLRRRRGEEPVTYPHPALEPVLRRTLGVPLFQEQVMRLAMVAADYSPGEADQLRRDMGAWRSAGKIERHRERLITRMVRKGIARPFAERVFEQIRGFGEYGFPESHAASFALIAYATAYLRRHHPEAFTAALLNAQPMGFYSVATIVQDARRHGVALRPVCVSRSGWDCTLEPLVSGAERRRFAVRMGLRLVAQLGERAARELVAERARAPFRDLEDLVRRTTLGTRALESLATAGAFACFGLSRREALWALRPLLDRRSRALLRSGTQPARCASLAPLTTIEEVAWDHESSGHSVRGNLFEQLAPLRCSRGWLSAQQLALQPDGQAARYVGLVICRQRPATAGGVVFMSLEDETGLASVVVFESVMRRYGLLVRTASLLGVYGRIENRGGAVHLIARAFWVPRLQERPPAVPSRDFH